jgi:hypothetical protein
VFRVESQPETSATHVLSNQRIPDKKKRVLWKHGICMEKEQHITAGSLHATIHLPGTIFPGIQDFRAHFVCTLDRIIVTAAIDNNYLKIALQIISRSVGNSLFPGSANSRFCTDFRTVTDIATAAIARSDGSAYILSLIQ